MEHRYDKLHYMDTSTTETPSFSLINEGIIVFDDDLAPKTETKQYIADVSERDILNAYKPSYKYTGELDHDDPVSENLYEIGRNQVIGAQRTITHVESWTLDESGACKAQQGTYNVIPSKAGSGAPGGALSFEGALSQVGVLIEGTWNPTTKAFTVPSGS